jgi:transmembrane sensor
MKKETFDQLIDRYLQGLASPEEKTLIESYLDKLEKNPLRLSPQEEQAARIRMLGNIQSGMIPQKNPVIPISWRKFAAAAIIIGIIATSIYFLTRNTQTPANLNIALTDIPPGRDAAILTLADGRQIILDSTQGTITNHNGIQIINLAGRLTYEGETPSGETVYNTVTTARGNQYQLQLEDGTKVWLNSASSLRYPIAFKGEERTVELTGEGYFEVARNKAKPFRVKTASQEIQVLGTHFNISSYGDEETIQTTLIEGSVKITEKGASLVLKPGQQALSGNTGMELITDVDLDKVTAWKTGWFDFDASDLKTIMRQVSRWYDVEVIYQGKPTSEKFGGRINKNVPLSRVLKSLEVSGTKFQLEGKVLKVIP